MGRLFLQRYGVAGVVTRILKLTFIRRVAQALLFAYRSAMPETIRLQLAISNSAGALRVCVMIPNALWCLVPQLNLIFPIRCQLVMKIVFPMRLLSLSSIRFDTSFHCRNFYCWHLVPRFALTLLTPTLSHRRLSVLEHRRLKVPPTCSQWWSTIILSIVRLEVVMFANLHISIRLVGLLHLISVCAHLIFSTSKRYRTKLSQKHLYRCFGLFLQTAPS